MRVGLFVTCLVDLMRPRIGFAVLQLLESSGYEVVVPESQTCCGQPGYNSGDTSAIKTLAMKFMREFEGCDYIVVPSGSCAGMIKVHYPECLKADPQLAEKMQAISERTFELTDFLLNVAKLKVLPGDFKGTITYHDSCSGLRELGVQRQPRELLAKMPDIQLIEMQESTTCCGFGGTFSVKYGEISTRMADNKCRHAEETGADAIVAGDLGCLLNIEGRLRRRGNLHTKVFHIAEILAGEDKK
ncbi:(Fe-S)-binding protein [Sulfurirhabdus autotrophica]|uniref:L-lactate dehydrogenase complex protein LldE n=1 Tax=Sulfurirhabdus autotrophica TaxID=1706046 RepID=A0A4R3XUR9_9PROT|nr:(Fe-S)-binding protein [Sulfurirhabdus autotrophica]TCV82890.1 L-lactate dehydrogenase complex protein LldE [Sulfurirhabdus autotrophica]